MAVLHVVLVLLGRTAVAAAVGVCVDVLVVPRVSTIVVVIATIVVITFIADCGVHASVNIGPGVFSGEIRLIGGIIIADIV